MARWSVALGLVGASVGLAPGAPAGATADENFVTAVYADFMFRAPTLDELTWWSAYLGANSRTAMVTEVLDLSEFEFLWVAGVTYQYLEYFDSESPLVTTQMADLASTGDYVETELLVLEGTEYFDTVGATNSGFVTELYRDVLRREPDAPGLAYWVGRLDNATATRRSVARSFIRTSEAAQRRVGGASGMTSCTSTVLSEPNAMVAGSYCIVLDRMATSGDITFWAGQLAGTGQLPSLWASMAGSSEYYTNAQ